MATKLRNRYHNKNAFLLLEAELAVVILLTIVIAATSSLSHLLRAQRDNENYLSAFILADEKLSEIQAYGLNKTIEKGDFQDSDFSWSYSQTDLEGISNITQLDLSITWKRKPRPSSFNVTTFILNE